MARLQYKICMEAAPDADGYTDVRVFGRQVLDGCEPSAWRCIVTKRVWLSSIQATHGRRLKTLLRSLA